MVRKATVDRLQGGKAVHVWGSSTGVGQIKELYRDEA